jgi:hypothetical protein
MGIGTVSQRRAIKLDTLPGVNLRLPVQRKVIGVLGDQHLRDQRLGRDAAFNDPRRRRGLHDRALAQTLLRSQPSNLGP